MDFSPHLGIYHGFGKNAPFFEGWYFKLVSADEKHRFAILPGVIFGEEEQAFVQVLNGESGHSVYFEYPLQAFRAEKERFEFSINKKNLFSPQKISFDIAMEHGGLKGELHFSGLHPGPAASGVDFSRGVVSMAQRLKGKLTIDSHPIDFTGGRGFIENIWGYYAPKSYVWFQGNHFPEADTALAASIFTPLGRGSAFSKFDISLLQGGKLHRFTAEAGAKIEKLEIGPKQVTCLVSDSQHKLAMTVTRAEGGLLKVPTKLGMNREVSHTLKATLKVRLSSGTKTVYQSTGTSAGLEILEK